MSTNTVLRDLRPDTEYKVTLVPIYDDMEGKRMSENGKTSEFSKSRESVETSHSQHCTQACFQKQIHNSNLKTQNYGN